MMILRMKDFAKTSTLAGAANGKRMLGKMLEAIVEPAEPTPLIMDFAEIEIATASFLRESVLRFRDIIRAKGSTLYPVAANVNDDIIDDLRVLIDATGNALMTCRLDAQNKMTEPKLIGALDPKQKLTFDLVNLAGETDAGTLMRNHSKDEVVGQTAWNNRLSTLASLGLVVEVPLGRAKRYRALFAET
jgi:hypothetical protein